MKMKNVALILLAIMFTTCSGPSSVSEEEALMEETSLPEEDFRSLISSEELELFNLVNEYRSSLGLGQLSFSMAAYSYAEEHTNLMISENALSHKNFNTRASGIANETDASHVAENVAKNNSTVSDAIAGWLASTAHKTTIEGDFNNTTVSIKENRSGETFYTQIFFKQ